MSMNAGNQVTCPNCKHQFSIESALTADIEKSIAEKMRKEYNEKYLTEKKKLEEGNQAVKLKLEEERRKMQEENLKEFEEKRKEIELQLKKKMEIENRTKLESLQKDNEEKEERLKNLRQLEVDKLEMQKQIRELRDSQEFEMRKMLLEKELEMKEKLGKELDQKNDLKIRELNKQLEDQKKLIEEMKRKSEQGSMQMQGEVQELALEEMLKQNFPFDEISEVGKGARGADLLQKVRNTLGQECGIIVWESKRTKEFQPLWIEKFKTDFRQSGGDIGVIVTQSMPKDMQNFGIKEGVYICGFQEAMSVAELLRESILRVYESLSANENKGEKMEMLYAYLTGNEFKHQIEAITEGFVSMKAALNTERVAMEKIWKEREKQIDKVLLNAAGMYGSIKGIAGSAVSEIKALDITDQNSISE